MIVRPNSSGAPQTGISGRPTGLPASPPRDYWCGFGVGRTGFILAVMAAFRDRKLGIEIYFNHRAAKRAFDLLVPERASIESEFGEPPEWQRMDDKKACRIAVYRTDLDPRDESQRPAQYRWFLDHMQLFAKVFGNRIRALPLDDAGDPDGLSVAADAAGG